MGNPFDGLAILTVDPLGSLSNILYPDGSELFGCHLEDYEAYMAELYGERWQAERTTLRLCHFDAENPPLPRDVYQDGEKGLDPKQFSTIWVANAAHELIEIKFSDGSAIYGMALANTRPEFITPYITPHAGQFRPIRVPSAPSAVEY